MTKRVAMMLGEGFEPVEAVAPIDALRRAGAEVVLVSVMNDRFITSAQDIEMNADVLVSNVNLADFDMIVVPGGSVGVDNLKKSPLLADALRTFMAEDRLIASICAGPTVLAELGLLDGRKATCYPGCETVFPAGVYVKKEVCVDGNLITSEGPGTALKFGIACVRALLGDSAADDVAKGMLIEA